MSKFVSSSSDDIQLKNTCNYYDVFLSFRGTNTRKSFTDHLLKALTRKGYHTFHDSKLKMGEYIDSELLKAIQASRMSIILFSKNYADSKWCLDELVEIMRCKKDFQHIVLPVFLDVEPSDVRKQEGLFAQAFINHQKHILNDERVEKWRKALKDSGKLSGLHLQNDTNGYEAKLVDKIIKEVAKHAEPCLNVAYRPVGIESRMMKLVELLQMEADDVRIVAVWGVGGLGKTTIAKATYNCIFSKFGRSSFLEDIKDREISELQNTLMADLLTDKTPKTNNVSRATEKIKRIFKAERVLVVLDDIDKFKQLEMLAIDSSFFIPGSRVIITTRDIASVLPLNADTVYLPEALKDTESLKLFSLYAFGKDHPPKDYEELTNDVVKYASGIPLVLKTIGSSSCKLSKSEWQNNLKKLRKVPNDDVQGKLKVSFDTLTDDVKETFLNISCFFIGMEKELLVNVMEDTDYFPENYIMTLTKRALVNIDNGILSMHNMIRDMGREIVRQLSLKEHGNQSRLWDHDDISDVFQQCSGTSAVESICHGNHSNFKPLESVDIKAFEKMPKLKLLLLHHLHLLGTYSQMCCFKKLKFMQCHGFSMEYMPSTLIMEDLVVMDMRYSRLKVLWTTTMKLNRLRFLNLSDSCLLTTTPDFSGMINLEKLLLARCSSLVTLDKSVTLLKKLCILDLSYCVNLKIAPAIVCILKMDSLEELYIYHCPKLIENQENSDSKSEEASHLTKLSLVECNLSMVPSEIGRLNTLTTLELHENTFHILPDLRKLHHLTQLTLSDCFKLQSIPDLPRNIVMVIAVNCRSLIALPSNMSKLHRLVELRLSGCEKLGSEDPNCLMKLSNLRSLSFLEMDNCNVFHVPSEIGNLVSLTFLNLGGNKFSSLPASISNLELLLDLYLSDCIELHAVPVLPKKLRSFKATNCTSLMNMPSNISELQSLQELHLNDCSKLEYGNSFYFANLEGLTSLVNLNMKNCNLSRIPSEIEGLVSLSQLDLSGNIFSSLPNSLCNLQNLKELNLNDCVALKSFPVLPPDFTMLKADNCTSLETLPFKPFFLHGSGQELRFSHCPDQVGDTYARNFKRYILQFHYELFQFQQVWPVIPAIKVSLSGTEIPDWCTYRGSQYLSFVVPKGMGKKFSGWIYCAIAPNCKHDECRLKCKVVNKTKGWADYIGTAVDGYGPMFLAFVPHLIDLIPKLTFKVEGGDELVLVFELECKNNWKVKKCGLYLIYEEDESIHEVMKCKVIEYTPSDLCPHLHQLVYEGKWDEFLEVYAMYINSQADDDSHDVGGNAAGDDHVSRDVRGGEDTAGIEDDSGSYDQCSYGVQTDGGPWFQLRLEELGDWLHNPLESQTMFR